MELQQRTVHVNGIDIFCTYNLKQINAVILHGAGKSSSKRFHKLAETLLSKDVGVVLFDFPGHGSSTGNLTESSLNQRKEISSTIIDTLIPEGSSFYLVGFSMSGQTVCDLLPLYSTRIKNILLGCPAIYSKDATTISFGDSDFKKTIRQPESWTKSTAPYNLHNFLGKTIIAIGSDDEVIPKGAVDLLKSQAQHLIYQEFDSVDHALAVWLSEHPKELEDLVKNLIE